MQAEIKVFGAQSMLPWKGPTHHDWTPPYCGADWISAWFTPDIRDWVNSAANFINCCNCLSTFFVHVRNCSYYDSHHLEHFTSHDPVHPAEILPERSI